MSTSTSTSNHWRRVRRAKRAAHETIHDAVMRRARLRGIRYYECGTDIQAEYQRALLATVSGR